MATSRKERDHRYHTSEAGKERRRRYDQKPEVRWTRRARDLDKERVRVLDALTQVRKELAQIERICTREG